MGVADSLARAGEYTAMMVNARLRFARNDAKAMRVGSGDGTERAAGPATKPLHGL